MTLGEARKKLMRLWMYGLPAPLLLIFVQTLTGKYGPSFQDSLLGMQWVLPLIMPQLVIMIGTARVTEAVDAKLEAQCNMTIYYVCLALSFAVIGGIALTLLAEPFLGSKVQDIFLISSLLLTAIQGVLASLIIMFFF